MKNLHSLLLCVAAALLTACGSKPKVEYLPFQTEEDGGWGMISPSGEVLFEDEFDNQPSVAMNGRFVVKNGDGMWEIYTTEERPRRVGDEYKDLCPFVENVTVAVKQGECVTIIDRDGNEVKKLDKLEGQTVENVWNFHEGRARFQTPEGLFGVIDTKGNVVVKPEYASIFDCSEGRIVAIHQRYKEQVAAGEYQKVKVTILSADGDEISTLSHSKYETLWGVFHDDVLVASKRRGGKECYGLLDEKGEWVLEPTSKMRDVNDIRDGHIIFENADGKMGVMDFDGEILLRARYNRLFFASDKLLFAQKDSDDEWKLIDLKGEQVGTETFQDALLVGFMGGNAFVETNDNEWAILKENGGLRDDLDVDIYNISTNSGESYVISDYVDIAALVDGLHIKADGMAGVSMDKSAAEVVAQLAADPDTPFGDDASNYSGDDEMEYTQTIQRTTVNLSIYFPSPIASPVYETVGGYYYSYQRIAGYEFNAVSPSGVVAGIAANGRLEGKEQALFDAITKRLDAIGQSVKKNAKNAVYKLRGSDAYAWCSKGSSIVTLYITKIDLSNLNIDTGDIEPTDSDFVAVDSAACSVAIDSVAY